MSGSAPLSEAERADVRRFCGYPVYGDGAQSSDVRLFYTAYATLEFRIGNLTTAELALVRSKLTDLSALDTAIVASGSRLSTESAAVWTRNRNEVRDRKGLYADRRRDLCGFLGVPPGPDLSSSTLSFIV